MLTLLSVNVGLPGDVAWEGRTVHTGIWKSPVPGPRMARRAGIGMTPVLAMLHHLAAQRSGREVWWIHGARGPADDAFANEVHDVVLDR
jgi:hypothetical protein